MPGPLVFHVLEPGGTAPGAPAGAMLPGSPPLPEGLALEVFRPRPWRLRAFPHGRLPLYLYWYLATRGRYEIWYVTDAAGRLVHYEHVLPRIPSFPFMGPRDLEVGPGWTDPSQRGRGVFKIVLHAIVAARRDAGRLWAMAETTNHASRRGLEKAGFRPVGHGRRRHGRYVLETTLADPAGPP